VIVAVGIAFTTTVVVVEVAEHPAAFVTVTVLAPAVFTMMDAEVAPFDHK
jgi:hypothetical protein